MKVQQIVVAGCAVMPFLFSGALAQTADPDTSLHVQHAQATSGTEGQQSTQALADQINELRAKLSQMEGALMQGKMSAPSAMQNQAMGMGMMSQPSSGMTGMENSNDGMPMMGMDMPMMSGKGGGMSGMPMMDRMEMMGMSRMGGGMQGGSMTSALPGFPGASHLYHVGATGFFLDHPEHIALSLDQQRGLGQIKEAALLEQAEMQRDIEQAEQELWVLTGADLPEASRIETKVREVETLKVEQRLSFIRAVGQAAKLLTEQQRQQLTGLLPPMPMVETAPMAGMTDE